MSFETLGLISPLLRAVDAEGYEEPTQIQREAIPLVLDGKDLLGCAQTGTGKTAAFALPILQRLGKSKKKPDSSRKIRSLVLTPTRELAAQIDESFRTYGQHTDLRCTVVYGGIRQKSQVRALKQGVDILVATPGRLMDLIGQGYIDLRHVAVFVLDEADRMLDMGFIEDIRWVIRELPRSRQTLFFSATMPYKIQSLADSILTDPVEVRIQPESPAADTVRHSVYFVERLNKEALLQHVLADAGITRALIFTRTKYRADRIKVNLSRADIRADVIHSDKPQPVRQRTLAKFKAGKTRILIASDIAARGLDVDDISHVINFDMPTEAEVYVHRIGRTGRAGATGTALSFCDVEERTLLDDIEKLLQQPIEPIDEHPYPSPLPRRAARAEETRRKTGLARHRRPARKRRL